MKALVLASALFALNAFAVEDVVPGSARNIKISHIKVGKVVTESVEVPCIGDTDLNCYKPVAWKEAVTVTIDYFTSPNAENEFFEVEFDATEFSAEELKALSIRSAVKRVQAAKNIFALNIREEVRTSTNTYCPYEVPVTCRDDEYITDTYTGKVKIVEVIKK